MSNARSGLVLWIALWLWGAGGTPARADGLAVSDTGGHDFTGVVTIELPAGLVQTLELPAGLDGIVPRLPGATVQEELVLERPLGSDRSWVQWRQDVHQSGSGTESYDLTVQVQCLDVTVHLKFLNAWPSEYQVFSGPNDEPMERLVIQYESLDLFP